MEKIYIIKKFDLADWNETLPIFFIEEKDAIDYCLQNTNLNNGIIYGYQQIENGKQEPIIPTQITVKDLNEKLLKQPNNKLKRKNNISDAEIEPLN